MMISEFTERTGFYPDANLYRAIEEAYNEYDGDKNQFCQAYKTNHYGLADQIARSANEMARKALGKKDDELWEARDDLKEAEEKIRRLEAKLEQEQEWKPYTDEKEVSDNEYVMGKAAAFRTFENDDEAKEWIAMEFGFNKSKMEVLHSKPIFEVSRHHVLRKVGEVNREPWYNATDWYYVRFQICGMIYEAFNGTLIQH